VRWNYKSGKVKVFPTTYSRYHPISTEAKNERIKPEKKKKEKSINFIKNEFGGAAIFWFVGLSPCANKNLLVPS